MLKSVKKAAAITAAVCSLGFAGQAAADIILTMASSQYIGLVNDGIPSNPADEVIYINTLVPRPLGSGPTLIGTESYTRSNNACATCPIAVVAGADKDESGANSINIGNLGYAYVLGKYDAGNAGTLVWYIAGQSGLITLPSTLNGLGLSHISLYNPGSRPPDEVPEPASLALLGLGMAAIALIRRRRLH